MKHLLLATSLVVLAGPAMAQAQTSPGAAPVQANPGTAQMPATQGAPGSVQRPVAAQAQTGTAEFATNAAIGDMFEIRSSELALQRTQNADYRAFANKIIRDHRENSEELKAMVQRSPNLQQIRLPTTLDQPHQQKMQQLQSADQGFERAYRTEQIAAHEQAIQLFDRYGRDGDNAELKAWAAAKVPVLQMHLEMAQALPQQAAPATAATQPAPGAAGMPARTAQPAPMAQGTRQPAPAGTAMQRQAAVLSALGPGHILASDLEGTNVYGAADEDVGEINEVILDRGGRVVAVIVGVGGFLGIGEKDVAIPFEALEIVANDRAQAMPQGTVPPAATAPRTGTGVGTAAAPETRTIDPARIVLRGMTREDLERAPEFRSVAR